MDPKVLDKKSPFYGLEDVVSADTGDSGNGGSTDSNTNDTPASTQPPADNPLDVKGNEGGDSPQSQSKAPDSPASTDGDNNGSKNDLGLEITDEHRTAILNEMFNGRFKTLDDFKNSNISEVLDQYPSLKEKETELEKRLNEKYNPFVNDEIAKINHFVKETGISNLSVYNKLNEIDVDGEVDPLKVLVTKQILDNPKYVGKEVELENYLKNVYKLDPERFDEAEIANSKFKLEMDSDEALKSIREVKEKISSFKPEDAKSLAEKREKEVAIQRENTIKQWGEIVPKIAETIPDFSVKVSDDSDAFVYKYSPEQKAAIQKDVLNYLVEFNKPMDKASVNEAIIFAKAKMAKDNEQAIYKAFYEKVSNEVREKYDKDYSNPSALNDGKKPNPQSQEKSDADKAYELSVGRYGKR